MKRRLIFIALAFMVHTALSQPNVGDPDPYASSGLQNHSGLFVIYAQYDFESQSLGQFTESEAESYMTLNKEESFINGTYTDNVHIVEETLNGDDSNRALRTKHWADTLNQWWEFCHDLPALVGEKITEIYVSYNMQFDSGYGSSRGGKLNYFRGEPGINIVNQCPDENSGWLQFLNFQRGHSPCMYNYNHSAQCLATWWSYPWEDPEDWDWNRFYFANDQWYNITERIVMNTFTGGAGNADGIFEVWIDGRKIYSVDTMLYSHNSTINDSISWWYTTHFHGGYKDEHYELDADGYVLHDNYTIYMPKNPGIVGHMLYPMDSVIVTPAMVTDRT